MEDYDQAPDGTKAFRVIPTQTTWNIMKRELEKYDLGFEAKLGPQVWLSAPFLKGLSYDMKGISKSRKSILFGDLNLAVYGALANQIVSRKIMNMHYITSRPGEGEGHVRVAGALTVFFFEFARKLRSGKMDDSYIKFFQFGVHDNI